MVLKIVLFQCLLFTCVHPFDGPQPEIILGSFPNETKSDSQPISNNKHKLQNPVTDVSSLSTKSNLFFNTILTSLTKPLKQKYLASESLENRSNVTNMEHQMDSVKHPVFKGSQPVESTQEVESTTSSPRLDVFEDKKHNYLKDLYNQNTTKDNSTLASLHSNVSLEQSSKSDVEENKTHSSLHSSVNLERLNVTDIVLVDDCNTTNSHSCEYGNFCSSVLILASTIYFHRTINIV